MAFTESGGSRPPRFVGLVGQTLGPYRLLHEIGRGGMGTVYRAVRADGEFQIEVAIKCVSPGGDFRSVSERFRTERQIQAKLEHPNIARLLDGGTTDTGLAYFVMEYVPGEPLTAYCDSHQLSVSERLMLFRKVCDAVSYAHEHLIVHRDLKPDNILVTKDGVPKLLDFGIAKILEPSSTGENLSGMMTMVRVGTPAYASPEQIRGASVGIGTDVYSLGIILYELLTGQRPHRVDALSWEESARVISEREATRPSALVSDVSKVSSERTVEISRARGTTVEGLRKRLSGDLDNIVGVALRKDPARRYRSVDQFSAEIQRHLDGLPVMARGDSFAYLTRKFIGRHKVGVVSSAVFTVAFCAAGIIAGWQAHRLANRVDQDRKLASSFLVDIHDALAKLPGSTPAREALLTKSVEYLNGLARESGNDWELRRSLALAYERFAELQVGVSGAGLGKPAEALKTYSTARQMREDLLQHSPADPRALYEMASNYLLGSYITGRVSSLDQRLVYDKKALDISEQLLKREPGNKEYQSLLAKAYTSAAYCYGMSGQWPEAFGYYEKALPIRKTLASADTRDTDAQRELANVHYRIGVIDAQAGKPRQGLVNLREALAIQEKLLRSGTDDERLRSDVASTHHFLGISLTASGDPGAALGHFHEAISLREAALSADERDARTRSLLAGNYAEQSTALLRSGRIAEALASIRRAVKLQEQLLGIDPRGVPTRFSLADYYGRLGAACAELRLNSEAARSWARSAELYQELDREGHLRVEGDRKDAERALTEAARWAKFL